MMGDWVGGQSEYHFVPYADFQLLRLPKDRAVSKMKQGLAFLSDILPTGYNVSHHDHQGTAVSAKPIGSWRCVRPSSVIRMVQSQIWRS